MLRRARGKAADPNTRITIFTKYGPVLLPPCTPKPFGVPMAMSFGTPEYWRSLGPIGKATPEELKGFSSQNIRNLKIREAAGYVKKVDPEYEEILHLRIKKILEDAGINFEDIKARWEEKQARRKEEERARLEEEERARREEEERARREEEERVMDEENLTGATRLYPITKYLGLLTPCVTAEARSLARQAKNEAAEFLLRNGYEMPVEILARWIADKSQLHTVHADMGHLGVVAMVSRIHEPANCILSYPTGHKDASAELKEQEPNNLLEKKMVNGLAFVFEETFNAAVDALRSVVQEDFKSTEITLFIAEYPRQGKRKLMETLPDIA